MDTCSCWYFCLYEVALEEREHLCLAFRAESDSLSREDLLLNVFLWEKKKRYQYLELVLQIPQAKSDPLQRWSIGQEVPGRWEKSQFSPGDKTAENNPIIIHIYNFQTVCQFDQIKSNKYIELVILVNNELETLHEFYGSFHCFGQVFVFCQLFLRVVDAT